MNKICIKLNNIVNYFKRDNKYKEDKIGIVSLEALVNDIETAQDLIYTKNQMDNQKEIRIDTKIDK